MIFFTRSGAQSLPISLVFQHTCFPALGQRTGSDSSSIRASWGACCSAKTEMFWLIFASDSVPSPPTGPAGAPGLKKENAL